MAEADRAEAQIYQLRAVIRGIRPMIWRRLLVRDDSTVAQLQEVLQIAFGWNDKHLDRVEIRGREYAVYREGGGLIGIDARRVRLSDRKLGRLERFVYEYDFRDSWVHDLRLEATLPINPRTIYPTCVAGKCAAPPEDCGGPHAFMAQRGRFAARVRRQSMEVLDDFEEELDDEDFDSVDDYDPDRFDRRRINRALQTHGNFHPLSRKYSLGNAPSGILPGDQVVNT
jgi:Plasmid pRiA4b ORF-3-like protein